MLNRIKIFHITIIVIVLLLSLLLVFYFNSLYAPAWAIRKRIINEIPIGTSMEQVLKFVETNVEKKNWEFDGIVYDRGILPSAHPNKTDSTIGSKSMEVYLGTSYFVLSTTVTAHFAFDEESKLIYVFIWKDLNSI